MVPGTVVRRESGGGSTMSMAQSVDILAHTSVYVGILLLLLSLPSPRRYITSFDPPLFVLDGLLFSYYCLVGLFLHLSVPILKKFMKLMLKTLANTNPVLSKLESCKYKEQKPLVDFDSTNSRACQSGLLVSNSDKTNAREASKGPCMTEGVLSLVDSTTRISSADFDAPENGACLVRANQSGPIMLNSEKKHKSEGPIGECLTESVLSLDDSTKRKSFPDFNATDKAHLVRAYQSGPVVSLSENQNRGEASKRECITKSMYGLEDLQQHCGGRPDAAAKSFRAIYDPGFHTSDSVGWKSFEVLETLPARKQPNDGVPLLLPGRLTLEGCVQKEKSPDLPRVMQFNGVEQRLTKMPRYLGGLTAQSASSSCGPIGLPDGGHIVLLDALDQSTKNIEHVATADQCSPTLSLPEKKMVRKTLNRNCRTMSVIFEEKHQRFVRICEGASKSLGAMCISRKHGINQVSMVEPIHKQRGIHQWPFLRSAVGLPDGEHILSLLEKKIVRKTLKRKCRSMSVLSLEDHLQHVDRRWEDAAKSQGAKRICRQLVIHRLSTAKCIRKQLGIHQWPFQRSTIGLPDGGHILPLSEKKIVRKTLKRKCKSMSVLSLVDRQQHVDRRWEDAAKNIGAKRICRQFVIHRVSIAKRICRQHGIHHRWPFKQSAIGLPDGGHILPLSEKKIVRKTFTRKCRSMSVILLVDRQQHVDRRWKDAAKNIGAKRICRQLVIHHVSIAKRIYRQHGIHHRWPFEQGWATMKGYSFGDKRPVEVIRLSIDGKLVSRLRRIYISWLGRFSPRPSALPRGGLIVGPIALSSSEFATTNNLAQRVGQDQRDSGASGSENERTREQEDSEEIRTGITKDDLLQLHGRMTRNDAAAILHVSVSTLKRKCKQYGIGPWENGGNKRVSIPPDQHGERNTSTAHETPSHNVQTGIEGVPVGQNQEANEFRPDFTEGSIHLNTGNGLITGSSFGRASQVNDQSTSSNPHVVFPQPQITSLQIENRGGSIDLRNYVASQAFLLSDGHISGSSNLAFPTRSDQAAPSQHVEGQSMQSTVYPDDNAFVFSSQEPIPGGHAIESLNRIVMIKAFYGEHTILKFRFPLTSGIDDLKKEVSKRLNVEVDRFEVKYMDEYGHLISILCKEDLMLCLSSSQGNDEIRVLVLDKVGGTPNSCEKCRSSMQTRA